MSDREPAPSLLYRVMRAWFKVDLFLFYNSVEVEGLDRVPTTGPCFVCLNHANSLVDAIIAVGTCSRAVRLTAKATLWKSPVWRFFVSNIDTIPIKRRKDYSGNTQVDNTEAFGELFGTLEKNACVGLYPEGISRFHSEMAPLKTGVARLALDFCKSQDADDTVLHIVPCGVTYMHREKFRSSVLVHYGEPIPVSMALLKDGKDVGEAAQEITAELQKRILDLTLSAPSWTPLRLAYLAAHVYRPAGALEIALVDHVALTRAFSRILVEHGDDSAVEDARVKLDEYRKLLKVAGVKDYRIAQKRAPKPVLATRALYRALVALALGTISLPGLTLLSPLIAVWRNVDYTQRVKGVLDNLDEVAQYKMLYLYGLLPIINLAWSIIIGFWKGPRIGMLSALLIPVLEFFTVRLFEDAVSSARALISISRLISMPTKDFNALQATRAKLHDQLRKLAETYPVPEPETSDKRAKFTLSRRRKKDWNETLRLHSVDLGTHEQD